MRPAFGTITGSSDLGTVFQTSTAPTRLRESVSAGSLHCDVWTGPALELLARDTLCVKPVNGWWRQRAAKKVCNQKTRYSMVVTLKTRNVDLDIYSEIKAAVDVGIPIETAV
jgi:hypothetical protein